MRKVLIANRGEIAVRIARACQDAGLASAAVYASADRDAVHVRAADEAVPLNGTTPAETYPDMSKVIVTGASREEALNRARRALHEFEITGLATNLPLHRALVTDEAFAPPDPARPFSVHTGWVESNWPVSAPPGG